MHRVSTDKGLKHFACQIRIVSFPQQRTKQAARIRVSGIQHERAFQ